MRKTNHQSIGQVLTELIKQNKLGSKLEEVELVSSWKKIVGDYMAKHTTQLSINKGILFVSMDSAACKGELMYKLTELLVEINKVTGVNSIKEIIIK